MFDMIGEGRGGDCGCCEIVEKNGGWKINGFIRLHLRVQTLSLYKFKFKISLVKTYLSNF